jgi:hypothetical protein
MQLQNREQLELIGVQQLERLQGNLQRQFIGMLEAGIVPPQSWWDAAERQYEEEVAVLLLLIMLSSIRDHGGDEAVTPIARIWSEQRAKTAAQQFAENAKERAIKQLQKLEDRLNKAKAKIETNTQPSVPKTPVTSPDIQQVDITEIIPDIAGKVLPNASFGDAAVTLTTQATSAGGEAVAHSNGTVSTLDIWYTEEDGRVCPVCAPLHETSRANWSRFFPDGPPAHPKCRCWVEYRP